MSRPIRSARDAETRNALRDFPPLNACPDPIRELLLDGLHPAVFAAGACIYHDGERCRHYLLVRKGTVRIEKVTADGHEITLHRVEDGEGCELSATSLLAKRPYPADAFAETRVEILFIDRSAFENALTYTPRFRDFVFGSINRGVNDLIERLTEVSFGRTNRRLAQCLIEHTRHEAGPSLRLTHHELAVDLGTAREVVSRLLKRFEKRGLVELHRGRLKIIDEARLRALINES